MLYLMYVSLSDQQLLLSVMVQHYNITQPYRKLQGQKVERRW